MSSNIQRHPDLSTLMSYAAGSLSEALSATVAGHVSLCRVCQRELRTMELLGAVLMDNVGATGAECDFNVPKPPATRTKSAETPMRSAADGVPGPLAERYGIRLAEIPWRRLGVGVWHYPLALSQGATGDLRLLKVAPGYRMPDHGHGGAELTLVLAGAYRDVSGTYRQGDLQDVDETVEHRPVGDPALGCICLIASERPARFKGLVGRLLQPLTGI